MPQQMLGEQKGKRGGPGGAGGGEGICLSRC